MTKYENIIYNIICTSKEHLTVEQVFQKVRETCPKVVLATIYNNINKLYESNMIRKVSIPGMSDRYDRIQKHDHLVCRRCGKLTDICFDDLTAPLQKIAGEEYLCYDLKIYYLCPDCRTQEHLS